MKHLVFAFMLMICTTPALAEDYTMTTYYPAPTGVYDLLTANAIGIGTTATAGLPLHIKSAGQLVQLETTTARGSGGEYIQFQDPSGLKGFFGYGGANDDMTVSNSMNADLRLNTNATSVVAIKPTGFVGIGVTAPVGPLHVRSATDAILNLQTTDNSGLYTDWLDNAGTSRTQMGLDATLFSFQIQPNNGTSAIVMASNAGVNVGIMANPPVAKLDIGGDVQVSGYGRFNGSNIAVGSGLGAEIGINGANEGFLQAATRPGGVLSNFNLQSTGSIIKLNNTGKIDVTTTGFGIGVAAAAEALEVAGRVKVSGSGILNSTSLEIIQTNAADWLRINRNNSWANGTAITGVVAIQGVSASLYVGSLANAGPGNIRASQDITADGFMNAQAFIHTSDERVKENIIPLTNALDKVQAMRGVYFNYKGKKDKKVGLIAQDVEKVVPEVVVTMSDGIKALDYSNLVAVLIEAIKEQETRIATLEKQVKALKGDVETLKKEH